MTMANTTVHLEINGAASAVTGYRREELLQMGIPDLLVTDGVAEMRDRFAMKLPVRCSKAI